MDLYGWSRTISWFSFPYWTLDTANNRVICVQSFKTRKAKWWYLYQYMGWIRKDWYQSFGSTGISILLLLEVWALVETVDLDWSRLNLFNIFPCFLQFRAKQIFIIEAWINVDSRVILLSAQCWNPGLELFWKLTHPFGSSPSSLRSTCWKGFYHHRVQVHQRQSCPEP